VNTRFFAPVSAACVVLSAASVAVADPQITTRVSSRRVEVGEPFTVQLSALVERGEPMPNDPRLLPPAGATLQGGPSVATSMVTINGHMRVGINATWQLVSNVAGRARIPAPTVLWSGRRYAGQPVQVDIVPSTGRSRRPTNPFLLPGGPGGLFGGLGFGGVDPLNPFGDDDDDEPEPTTDDKFELRTAPDPYVFLHARADKTSAVIGEQVTVSFYVYQRVNVEMAPVRDAAMTDFIRMPMLSTPGFEPPFRARAGGKTYQARLVDRVALFPVRAGDLHVGPMTIKVSGVRVGRLVDRSSEDLVVHVEEPPRANRPPGYVLGDVGRFRVSATVEPRRTTQGGSVAVTVQVKGNGNFPQRLAVPARTGIEWLDPEKRESIGPQGGIISGVRTFGYVVRIEETGAVDLGTIELPHWDPASKRYEVASVSLGTIDVEPRTNAAPSASPNAASSASPGATPETNTPGPSDPFATLPSPRAALGAYSPPPEPLFEGGRLFFAVSAPPLAFGLFAALGAGARRIRARRAAGASSPARLASLALADADAARERADAKDLSAAVERALHHAIEAATGLKSRGILLDDLAAELEDAGVPEDLAKGARSLLDEASAIRFDPGTNEKSLDDLARRGKTLVRDLLALSGRTGG